MIEFICNLESQSVCECELQAFLRAYIVMIFCRIVH